MKLNDAYPSNFLKAEDLQGKEVSATIDSAELQEIGQGQDKENKIIVSFVGKSKKLVCNKTNFKSIAALCGDDTDDWRGKTITLYPTEVPYGPDMVWSIRVRGRAPGTNQRAAVHARPPVTDDQAANLTGGDDQAPF